MSGIMEITDANFDTEVKKSSVPFLLDFSATWCGPCKQLHPILEDVAKDMAGKIRIGKIDVDANQRTASSFGIMSVPTMILFKGGQVKWQNAGVLAKAKIVEKLTSSL